MTLSIYSSLPSMEHVFSIDLEGTQTKARFTGQFTYRRPTIQKRSEIAKTVAKLNGDQKSNLDDDMKSLHQVIGWLEHCLVEFPDWWKESNFGMSLYDDNIITELSSTIFKFEEQWQKQVGTP